MRFNAAQAASMLSRILTEGAILHWKHPSEGDCFPARARCTVEAPPSGPIPSMAAAQPILGGSAATLWPSGLIQHLTSAARGHWHLGSQYSYMTRHLCQADSGPSSKISELSQPYFIWPVLFTSAAYRAASGEQQWGPVQLQVCQLV